MKYEKYKLKAESIKQTAIMREVLIIKNGTKNY